MGPRLYNAKQFRLDKINEIKGYFADETEEREKMSKILSKYIAAFDYFEKTLFVLSAANGGASIIWFAIVIGIPVFW